MEGWRKFITEEAGSIEALGNFSREVLVPIEDSGYPETVYKKIVSSMEDATYNQNNGNFVIKDKNGDVFVGYAEKVSPMNAYMRPTGTTLTSLLKKGGFQRVDVTVPMSPENYKQAAKDSGRTAAFNAEQIAPHEFHKAQRGYTHQGREIPRLTDVPGDKEKINKPVGLTDFEIESPATVGDRDKDQLVYLGSNPLHIYLKTTQTRKYFRIPKEENNQ